MVPTDYLLNIPRRVRNIMYNGVNIERMRRQLNGFPLEHAEIIVHTATRGLWSNNVRTLAPFIAACSSCKHKEIFAQSKEFHEIVNYRINKQLKGENLYPDQSKWSYQKYILGYFLRPNSQPRKLCDSNSRKRKICDCGHDSVAVIVKKRKFN